MSTIRHPVAQGDFVISSQRDNLTAVSEVDPDRLPDRVAFHHMGSSGRPPSGAWLRAPLGSDY